MRPFILSCDAHLAEPNDLFTNAMTGDLAQYAPNFTVEGNVRTTRLGERVLPQAAHRIEYGSQPGVVNNMLLRIFSLELGWLRHRPLPLGTSAYCVATRQDDAA